MSEYMMLIEEAIEDVQRQENNRIDAFVDVVNRAKNQSSVLPSEAAITFRPEPKKVAPAKVEQPTYESGFWDGFASASMLFTLLLAVVAGVVFL